MEALVNTGRHSDCEEQSSSHSGLTARDSHTISLSRAGFKYLFVEFSIAHFEKKVLQTLKRLRLKRSLFFGHLLIPNTETVKEGLLVTLVM